VGIEFCRIARELCARDDRHGPAAEDGDAVPALLAFPHCLEARPPDRGGRKSASVVFSSCRQTTSGFAWRSHSSRFGSRFRMLLMLKLVIFMRVPVISPH
jgi:hypothetical protein